ncbi:hypothetical protein FE257_004018 [Aspergillus nanangensis]|uniref:Zn(2)-C6 fungal-type domain-containing protein n=1 Tax=Aspergillus nanangensis TaxID=2582783 RepID=A0AAD4GW74_ASPNN|nr:hypothetical protein FE257_004018 [Aspergillus nanangensis]
MAEDHAPSHHPPSPSARKKRPKIKGCYECSRRRIDCDRQPPSCQKCTLKGLKCSGMGIRYRFTEGVASRGKLAGKQVAVSLSYRKDPSRRSSQADVFSEGKSLATQPMDDDNNNNTTTDSIQLDLLPLLRPPPQHIDGATLYFLQYFAQHLAPVNAVIDRGFNGYRDLILPFAESDRLVRDAIVLVSRQHLSLNSGDSLADSIIYNRLIRGLLTRSCKGSFLLRRDISSMTALLLLNLREVISGSGDFKLVYSTLRAFFDTAALSPGVGGSCELTKFVTIQLLRVRLFAEALFDESHGAQYLSTHGVTCLEFLRYCQRLHPEHEALMADLFTLVTLACDVYVKRAGDNPPSAQTYPLVERFRQVAENVKHYGNVLGQNLLSWPYFVMAAESSTPAHREFFDRELQSLLP